MRLLNIHTLNIDSGFPDHDLVGYRAQLWNVQPQGAGPVPPYAILSHCWIGDEVTFPTFATIPKERFCHLPSRNPVPLQTISGTRAHHGNTSSTYKIAGACHRARHTRDKDRHPIGHIWIDTVCVNKADERELASSFNSKFRWYRNAVVCFVYLVDVSWTSDNIEASRQRFRNSEWFREGWTLQELLAPKRLEFYDRDWQYIGSKDDLMEDISTAANILPDHLVSFKSASLAQKMSWLAHRRTTHLEDMAYCALDIFGVHLNTRYGQGELEWTRLQEEIISTWPSNKPFDESLFAWTDERVESSGLLAPAPGCFRYAGNVIYDQTQAKSRTKSPSRSPGIDIRSGNAISLRVPWGVTGASAKSSALAPDVISRRVVNSVITQCDRQTRNVGLNCWIREPNGKLCAMAIKMRLNPNNTWQRIDCGTLYRSETAKLCSSGLLTCKSDIQMNIKHESKWKPLR